MTDIATEDQAAVVLRLSAEIEQQQKDIRRLWLLSEDWKAKAKQRKDEIERLREALKLIAEIKNNDFGGDYDEIDTARDIANSVLGDKP